MTYDIIWQPPAFDEMQELIRALPDRRSEFASALAELSAKLSENPEEEGESREPPYRVGFFGRLTVRFRVATDRGRVYILRVHMPFDNLESF